MKNELITVKKLKEILNNCLPEVRIRVYYVNEIKRKKAMKPKKNRYTLNQIGEALFNFIKTTNFRLDKIENRLDKIENRLDYVIKANNLKDLTKSK